MNKICSLSECENVASADQDKCILHCQKSEYAIDFKKAGFLKSFNDELIKYIAKYLNQYHSNEVVLPYDDLVKYFTYGIDEIAEANREKFLDNIKSHFVVLNYIVFPDKKSIDSFNYINVLQKLDRIYFNFCEFQVSQLGLEGYKLFFQDCIFHKDWNLKNYRILENVDDVDVDVLYQSCVFLKKVISSSKSGKLELEALQFKSCKFKTIYLEETVFKKPLFNNWTGFQDEIESVEIFNCIIEDAFILDSTTIKAFTLHGTLCKSVFEFKDNRDVKFCIENSIFEGRVHCYKTFFENVLIKDSTFHDFVGFGKCRFRNNRLDKPACFQNVTFLSFVNFRDAHFYSGLDMRGANLKEYPNFSGAKVSPENTDKETFRIIKHSFDKVGNVTEANKYFLHEMQKERREISWDEPDKKILSWFNYHVSNFGKSFILPLFWILILAFIHYFVNMAMDISPKYHIVDSFNTFAKNILPFKYFLQEGKEFVSLLFLTGYLTLIYHFIVAVKRRIKR